MPKMWKIEGIRYEYSEGIFCPDCGNLEVWAPHWRDAKADDYHVCLECGSIFTLLHMTVLHPKGKQHGKILEELRNIEFSGIPTRPKAEVK